MEGSSCSVPKVVDGARVSDEEPSGAPLSRQPRPLELNSEGNDAHPRGRADHSPSRPEVDPVASGSDGAKDGDDELGGDVDDWNMFATVLKQLNLDQ